MPKQNVHYAKAISYKIYFDIGTRNKQRLITVTDLIANVTQEHFTVRAVLHAL